MNKVEEVASLLIDLVNSLATPCTILLHHVLLDRLGEPALHREAGQQVGHGQADEGEAGGEELVLFALHHKISLITTKQTRI